MGMFDYSVLWKTSLNIDGHPFHQYQQNDQSHLILTELTKHKKTSIYDVGNPGTCLGQAKQCGGVFLSLLYILLIDLYWMFKK
jgi:hypothetical protein